MRTLHSAAILLGLSAGFGAFINSPVHAIGTILVCPFTSSPSTFACVGPASGPSFAPTVITAGSGTISYENPGGNMYSVKTGFAPTVNTASSVEKFEYSLTLPVGQIWSLAGLTTNMLAGFPGGDFKKLVCSDSTYSTCVSPINLTNTNVSSFINISSLNTREIYVRDTYQSVNGGTMGYGQISDFTNTFEAVPGPLPVLGAGAAFGFSRKLRKRIKSAG